MCIAGAYTVNGMMLDIWLPDFITKNEGNYNSLKEFTELLKKEFEGSMKPEEKARLSIAHIAGYVNGHPEMWRLSNTTLSINGTYDSGHSCFHCSEDLWGRDWEKYNLEKLFGSKGLNYQIYVNSSSEGRAAFNMAREYLDTYFSTMFLSKYKFRYPVNLEEHGLLVETYISVINTMYKISDYEPKEIGGKIQLFFINKP